MALPPIVANWQTLPVRPGASFLGRDFTHGYGLAVEASQVSGYERAVKHARGLAGGPPYENATGPNVVCPEQRSHSTQPATVCSRMRLAATPRDVARGCLMLTHGGKSCRKD